MKYRVLAGWLAIMMLMTAGCGGAKEQSDSSVPVPESTAPDATETTSAADTETTAATETTTTTATTTATKTTVTGADKTTATKAPTTTAAKVNHTVTVNGTGSLQVSGNAQLAGLPTELPPQTMKIGGVTRAVFSTGRSVTAELLPGKTVMDKDGISLTTRRTVSRAGILEADASLIAPAKVEKGGYWRRNYHGVFSAYTAGGNVVAFLHGENKNEILNGTKYNNTVLPEDFTYFDGDYSGYTSSGDYNDAWGYYFGFLSMAVCPESTFASTDSLRNGDRGPIIWPDNGYVNMLDKGVSNGLRHPCVFTDGGYVYVYYLDTESNSIKLARAKQNADGTPGAFFKYAAGSFNVKALPDGFDKNDPAFLRQGTEESDSLFRQDNPVCFRVAKVKGTSLYLGVVEDIHKNNSAALYLRVSEDLVHWSDPVEVPLSAGSTWKTANLHYPVITDGKLCTVSEVDPSDFCLLGSVIQSNRYLTQSLHLSITVR